MTSENETPTCSFCNRSAHQVDQIVTGPSVHICSECIAMCNEIISQQNQNNPVSELTDEKHVLSDSEVKAVVNRLSRIPLLIPRDIEQRLLEKGYRGQEYARRAGSVLAYRHLRRLRDTYMEGRPVEERPERENYLFLGSTGSGKTFLVELLFREILSVPTLVADVTRFTESGYIGDDVQMLLSQLYELAEEDRGWASCGVICLDEFDKLAASRSQARFAGEGTTKDVSGFGVQRGLLTLLSGSSSPFPTDFGYSGHGSQLSMPLSHLTFIACGAFSGLKDVAVLNEQDYNIGFRGTAKPPIDEAIATEFGHTIMENTRAFSSYGFLPELIGRFSRLVAFLPLAKDLLREILENNLLQRYRNEFEREGIELIIEDTVLDHVVDAAHRRETGARGLRASLVPHLEDAAFECFGGPASKVTLTYKNEKIEVEKE